MLKNKLFMMSFAIVLTLAVLAGTAFSIWYFVIKEPGPHEETEKVEVLPIEEIVPLTIDTEEIITNLQDDRILKVQFKIQTDNEESKAELEQRLYQVNNIILHTLSSSTSKQLEGSEGINFMETTILAEINKVMLKGSVVDVVTTKKIVQ